MTTEHEKDPKMQEQAPDKPTGVKNLYIAHIDELGKINGDLVTRFRGDVLIYRQAQDDRFKVEHLRRLALYGVPDPDQDTEPIGVISLAGPLGDPELTLEDYEPEAQEDIVFEGKFPLQVHYHGLSELGPRSRTKDSVSPVVEVIGAKLVLRREQEDKPDESEVRLNVDLQIGGLIDERLGRVDHIRFERFTRSFHLAGSESHDKVPQLNSLQGCSQPSQDCGNDQPYNQEPTVVHRLRLKFINVSSTNLAVASEKQALESVCQDQIDGVCEVWVDKAAINLEVEPDIDDADSSVKECYKVVGDTKQKRLPCAYAHSLDSSVPDCDEDPCLTAPTDPYPDHVEVYLVDRVEGSSGGSGGGITRNDGQASAYCILQLDQLPRNRYLLAHELGHVVGVTHPWIQVCPGSWGSIMQPGTPNSPTNTRQNCKILAPRFAGVGQSCLVPLNSIVRSTLDTRNFCLDA